MRNPSVSIIQHQKVLRGTCIAVSVYRTTSERAKTKNVTMQLKNS